MSIADDIRAAANAIDFYSFALSAKDLSARLRAHADTIERVEKEMCWPGYELVGPSAFITKQWADALKGEKT